MGARLTRVFRPAVKAGRRRAPAYRAQARESGRPGSSLSRSEPPLFWSVSSLEIARMGSSTWPADRVPQILWGPEN